jgi:hypothetical protein
LEEPDEAPEGYDHATPAQIEQPVECGDCGRTIPAGEWLWLFSRGDVEEADEVRVVCGGCAETRGCSRFEPFEGNGASPGAEEGELSDE